MPITDAQKRATAKYRAKTYEQILIPIRRDDGTRARWKAAAAEAGKSLSGFVKEAVEEKILRDGLAPAPTPPAAPE